MNRPIIARLTAAWRALDAEQRLAALASLGLFVSMFLPWYQQNAVVNAPKTAPLQSRNLNAFQVFSFVEAAVLLVALAVAYLLYARAESYEFHLPGSDGAVVLAAGLWTAALLVFRLFDKPGIGSHGVAANVGVQWGIFFALAAAGLLAYAGARMRAVQRPGAPLERAGAAREDRGRTLERPDPPMERPDPPMERPDPPIERPLAPLERPQPSGERPPPPLTPAGKTPARPRYPPAPSGQMSFEDPPPQPD